MDQDSLYSFVCDKLRILININKKKLVERKLENGTEPRTFSIQLIKPKLTIIKCCKTKENGLAGFHGHEYQEGKEKDDNALIQIGCSQKLKFKPENFDFLAKINRDQPFYGYDVTDENKASTIINDYIKPFVTKIMKASPLIVEKEENTPEGTTKMHTDIIKRLKLHHNIVLHGAPGTGKTYLAKKIAKLMNATEEQIQNAENEKNLLEEIEATFKDDVFKLNDCHTLVQFHPSYDYTDFVEGLRSYEGKDGTIGFRREDGVFKEFCKKALIQAIADHMKEESDSTGSKSFNDFYKDYVNENWKIDPDKTKKFVFIVDEINRGNMSKIFGELFFSIDPGYRGLDGRVQTQYQKLVKLESDDIRDKEKGLDLIKDTKDDVEDLFKNGFFVPENVYIIGTMNDIDRSVECMDFAFRRRFVFEEIKAFEGDRNDDNIKKHWLTKELNDNGTAVKVMNALNDAIFCDDKNTIDNNKDKVNRVKGLNSGYHIGPSYFEKLDKFRTEPDTPDAEGSTPTKGEIDRNSYDKLWNYCLKPLLREYVRGNAKPDEDLGKLRGVYEKTSETKITDDNT